MSESPGGGRVNLGEVLFCLLLVEGWLDGCAAFIIKDSSRKPVDVFVALPSQLLSRGLGS